MVYNISYVAVLIALAVIFALFIAFSGKPKVRKVMTWFVVIAAVLALGFYIQIPDKGIVLGGASILGTYSVSSSGTDGSGQTNDDNGATTIVTTNPTINIAGADAQQTGTTVGTSGNKLATNGGPFTSVTLGTTTAVPGQVIDLLLVNSTSYHNAVIQNKVVEPNTFPMNVLFNKNATITESVYTTTGLVITNGGGAQNQTDLGNGQSYNLKDEMTANALTSTQDMVCVIEIESGNNASTNPAGASLALNGNVLPVKSTSKPVWYSTAGTNSNVYLFDVPAISTTGTQTFTIGLNAKSSGRFQATSRVIKSCYTKEWFADTSTGKLTYDVADSLGTLKSIATYTYTIYFQ